ncbi:hypothetical protein BT96DRAFT_204322 [Gymnopus androsaceus JB14]|uniref:Uncharacterized protein n=1 Tax=Gymnopus androsaceus JB14 TaxID=1447944 RepID=A0A6A4ID56_9AGAR|nr:hypothetical protein BT96DRAFT_204322 [Gymnopus androsaceus JB14]
MPDHDWKNVDWYHGCGNAEIPNGEWKEVQIAKYVPAVGGLIFPPGFDPVENLESVVTYFSISFTNINQWFEGLGIGILMQRDDHAQRLALKYRVPRFRDNEMNLAVLLLTVGQVWKNTMMTLPG